MWARVRGEQSDGAGDILRSGRNELSRIMSQQRQYGEPGRVRKRSRAAGGGVGEGKGMKERGERGWDKRRIRI